MDGRRYGLGGKREWRLLGRLIGPQYIVLNNEE